MPLVIHYAENNGRYVAYCGGYTASQAVATPKMKFVTCKKCLAKLKRDSVIK